MQRSPRVPPSVTALPSGNQPAKIQRRKGAVAGPARGPTNAPRAPFPSREIYRTIASVSSEGLSSDPANGTNATPITEPPGRRKKHWRLVSSLVGYGLNIALALRTIDKERFIAVLSRLGFTDFAIVLGLIACHIGMRALRYHALTLRARPKHYRLLDAVRIFLFGLSASVVTPARAGDVIKAELLHEHGVRRAVGLGIVVIERLLDLL